MLQKEPPTIPKIRSFIRRQGRMTPGQLTALEELWDHYCLDPQQKCDFEQAFGRTAPIYLEIGFGNGESLIEMALAHPENNYIGIEVHKPGVAHLMIRLKQKGLDNVRIYYHDAVEILEQWIDDNCLSGLYLFFPDPWQKQRHHKRRLVSDDFVQLLCRKLKTGGFFHSATDWDHYAKHMIKTLSKNKKLKNCNPAGGFSPRPDFRHLTKFERRGIQLGHGVWDVLFEKQG